MTSRATIESWFKQSKDKDADFMLVITDTYDFSDYPLHCMADDVHKMYEDYDNRRMQRVTEVYDLNGDMSRQLSEERAMHLPEVINE